MNDLKNKIWRGLVDYANGSDLEASPEALNSLAAILSKSMPWMARTAFDDDVPAMIALRTNREVLFGQVQGKRVWMCFKSEEELASQFQQQAIEYQPHVRHLLRWLSDPKRNEQDRPKAFGFLFEHTRHIQFQRGDPAYASEQDSFRYFTLNGDLKDDFPHRTLFYKDLADVICDFIQREHEAQRIVPVRICKRPGCGNPVTGLKKREYCGTAFCDKERQKRDDDVKQRKNRDSVFLHRLRKMTPVLRRKRARESVERLHEIANYWRDGNQALAKHALRVLNEIDDAR